MLNTNDKLVIAIIEAIKDYEMEMWRERIKRGIRAKKGVAIKK